MGDMGDRPAFDSCTVLGCLTVSTIIDPVGPHEPSVYWRRRLVLGLVLLVALLLLFRACSGGGGDDEPTASSRPTETATEEASERATDEASEEATSTATSSPTSTEVKNCRDADIDVTVTTNRTEYAAGSSVDIRYVVSTKDGVTCKRDVGAGANEVKVVQADNVIWSSDFCSPSAIKDVRTLGPNASYSVVVQWDGTVTPEDCPSGRSTAPVGDYEVQGRNGDLTGSGKIITLT
jgi:hypothetical protein